MWPLTIILAVVAVPVVVGFLMPVRYVGSTTVDYERGVQLVWDALQDVTAHPMTGKMMKSVEILPANEEGPAWLEDMGRGEVITVTSTAHQAPHHMIREMTSATVNMTSRWDYRLESTGDGCTVTLSGTTDIERGTWHTPIFRLMMIAGGGVKRGLDTQLDMVASTLGTEARRPS